MSNIENDGAVYAWNPNSRGREDAGAAGRGALSARQREWQDVYYNPELRAQGLANDNRMIGTRTTPTWNMNPMDQLATLFGNSGFSSGSGSGNSSATRLGFAELAYKKAKDARDRQDALDAIAYERAQEARKLTGLTDYYKSGQYGQGFDALLKMIGDQGKVSEEAIGNAYERALANLSEGYGAAKGLGDAGYSALNAYLAANPNNPYAGMTASAGTPADALSNYLSAYGVSDLPVQGQIQADQLQAQQGAANYQNLLDTLGAVAQQGAGSRGAESQMAQLLFNTGLGQERAGYQSQAENARAQALAALQQAMYESRLRVEQDRMNLANQLAQSIAAAGGSSSGSGSGDDKDKTPPPSAAVEQLLKEIAARQEAGTQRDPVQIGFGGGGNPFEQMMV